MFSKNFQLFVNISFHLETGVYNKKKKEKKKELNYSFDEFRANSFKIFIMQSK